MPRIGTNPNVSSDTLEAKMLPDVEGQPQEEGVAAVDYAHDGVHKVYSLGLFLCLRGHEACILQRLSVLVIYENYAVRIAVVVIPE